MQINEFTDFLETFTNVCQLYRLDGNSSYKKNYYSDETTFSQRKYKGSSLGTAIL